MKLQIFQSLKTKLIAAIAIMILMVAGFPVSTASASVCTSQVAVGNWSSASTWSCGYVPGPSDDVVIDGTTITMDVPSATVSSLTINDGATNSSLTIAGTNALTVTNNVFLVNTNSNTTKSVDVGAGTLNIGGDLKLFRRQWNESNPGNSQHRHSDG